MAESKKITLHPLNDDGSMDFDTNLYPKTNNFVDEEGNLIEVATKDELALKADKSEIPTDVVTHEELAEGLGTKQDVLISDINIKTINNESILGSGNIFGGTKLYKHRIDFVDSEGNSQSIETICNSNTPATKQAPYGDHYYIVLPNATVLMPIIYGYSANGQVFELEGASDKSTPFSNCPVKLRIYLDGTPTQVVEAYLGATGSITNDTIIEL